MTNLQSRRSFLKGSLAGAAAVASSTLVTQAYAQPRAKVPAKWDEKVDVIVVGSGFAGLAAAIEAKKAGANVIVLEKMPTAGGNSIINGGILTATGCPQQLKHGIKDSVDLLAQDILVAGAFLNDPAKVRVLAEHALSNYEWTVKELGVEYNQDAIGQEGGHSVPRYVFTKNGSGSGIVTKELEKLEKMGVKVRLRTYVEHIIRDDSGRVVGLQVREGYRFPKEGSGKTKFIAAKKGVILCHGGFSADPKFRVMHDPKLTDKFSTTNQPGATAELWREASNIGCAIIQADWIQCGPWSNPKEKGMGIGWTFTQSAAAEYGLWVNTKGQRFVNELANRKVRADAIFAEEAKGLKAVAIANQYGADKLEAARPGVMKNLVEPNIIGKYNTLEELAADFKIPVAELKKSVAQVNESAKTKNDTAFGRYINNEFKPLTEGPWYAAITSPKVHHCMGGLLTNMKGQVIDIMDQKPIPGLYAAGEATGGVHGAVRLGSCAILDCLVNGRICGQEIVKA